jgi:hypothetical protein
MNGCQSMRRAFRGMPQTKDRPIVSAALDPVRDSPTSCQPGFRVGHRSASRNTKPHGVSASQLNSLARIPLAAAAVTSKCLQLARAEWRRRPGDCNDCEAEKLLDHAEFMPGELPSAFAICERSDVMRKKSYERRGFRRNLHIIAHNVPTSGGFASK